MRAFVSNKLKIKPSFVQEKSFLSGMFSAFKGQISHFVPQFCDATAPENCNRLSGIQLAVADKISISVLQSVEIAVVETFPRTLSFMVAIVCNYLMQRL